MTTFLPADACSVCEGSHLPGRRIVAGPRGTALLRLSPQGVPSDWASQPVLTPSGPMHLLTHGACWTSEARERAADAARKGRHPWLCQRCVRLVCEACGGLWNRPVLHDFLEDDGSTVHSALLGVAPRCRDCGRAVR